MFEIKNPLFKETILKKLEKQHFMHHIQANLTSIEAGKVSSELEIKDIHKQQNGFVHGGVTSTMADLVMGFAAYSLVSDKQGTVTSDLKISYLRPGIGEKIIAEGYVIKQGNLLFFCEADIFVIKQNEKTLIARGYSTMVAIGV